ncbi:hypothetical protein HFK85_23955 [Ralstonia pseudosolanacearum]|uniref:hypothetical protein n=1 Tax=Ralstonia pseudosolanacearum TaxID=1310165 RepID=UPI00200698C2|nr:hypothetical protein [Ralstonia pseudosolanacearum]MCK4140389.1 hypothetical protein [Ralstonia pseudosolanacearum]
MREENIVRYWHAVELLQPQAAPKLEKRDSPYESFIHEVPAGQLVTPWSADSLLAKQTLPKKRVWSHTLFAQLYDSKDVAEKLKALYGADQGYKEPQSRESALIALKFSADGLMVEDSLVLSSEAWFLGRALAGEDWKRGFDEAQLGLREQIKSFMGGKVSAAALRGLTEYIRRAFGVEAFFGDKDVRQLRFRSTPIQLDQRDQEDDPLNSFLLSDMADVADSLRKGVTSAPLEQYLNRHDSEQRTIAAQQQLRTFPPQQLYVEQDPRAVLRIVGIAQFGRAGHALVDGVAAVADHQVATHLPHRAHPLLALHAVTAKWCNFHFHRGNVVAVGTGFLYSTQVRQCRQCASTGR